MARSSQRRGCRLAWGHRFQSEALGGERAGVTTMSGAHTRELAAVRSGLRAIGYREHLIRRDYTYADFFDESPTTRSVALAAFSQEPPSYVTACFGVVRPNGSKEGTVAQCTALGAPQIIALDRGAVERWSVYPGRHPKYLGRIPLAHVRETFARRRDEWGPEAVSRAKVPVPSSGPRQLDFVDLGFLPALEHEAQAKLDELITGVVHDAQEAYGRRYPGGTLPVNALFHLLFGLIRAKVLRDTGALPNIDLAKPMQALRTVEAYHRTTNVRQQAIDDPAIISAVAHRVDTAFLFQNLSAETLAYVYENTLVSPEQRRSLGIHSTPSYVADYVLSRLPVEEVPIDERRVLDPTCGQGTFLVAAIRRLRGLLPHSMVTGERHDYFTSCIRGIDYDLYSCEVAKLSLLLADLPNPNGWQVRCADSFLPGVLESAASSSCILVGNPPFKAFTAAEKNLYRPLVPYKGGEMLRRVLSALSRDALLGVVMPRKLVEGKFYAGVRRELDAGFQIIELTCLPDRVFPKSDAETVLVMARKLPAPSKRQGSVRLRYVSSRDRIAFQTTNQPTWETQVPQERFAPDPTPGGAPVLSYPRYHAIWDSLAPGPRVGHLWSVHRGVEYEDGLMRKRRAELVRDAPFEGSAAGLDSAQDQLAPYRIQRVRYLATDLELRRRRARGAWDLPWSTPKVVTNANRSGRGPWRLVAAVDNRGLLCTQTFGAIWPKEGTSVPMEFLAAVLNGPVANAFVFDHEPERDNRNQTIEDIPFPSQWRTLVGEVVSLISSYLQAVSVGDDATAAHRVIQIDAKVLKAYGLSPREEREILDLFWEEPRPGLETFRGYIPPEFTAWVPLDMYLSDAFQLSTAENIVRGAPSLADPEIQHLFDLIE
jgi:hypothetical protein